ncbi:type III secretion HpaP family protein [Rhodanobacter sp. Col0626]|uniref:type III secretion HpaP family protein n=1 Tax=Rhodanobacter sp. Col0626 TaxID=3415679 RepID=UPI003CE97697
MRNESTTSSSRDAVSSHVHAPARGSKPGKPDATHDHENVQRFRKLMDGKASGRQDPGNTDELTDLSGAATKKLSLEQEQALRELLQRQMDSAEGKAALIFRDDSEGGDSQSGDTHDDQAGANAGAQLLQQTTQATQYTIQQPTAAAQSAFTPALAELIERHVKQLLVPDATSRSSAQSREIMITLKNGLLPDTDLWLSRTDKGWRLRADTHSANAYHALVEGAPQLIERFASSKLGELEVDPVLLG